jgi:hypothetical protein
MPRLIERTAEALRAEAPYFTKRNLYFAARRARGAEIPEARFDAALQHRLARGSLPGLLRERQGRAPQTEGPGVAEATRPDAVLLVDRPAIRDLFLALAHAGAHRFAVVCIDGTPKSMVARVARSFQKGLRSPVLYLHDAATVVYPFALEPLATAVRHQGDTPLAYRDIGLPPLGATARRFGDPSLPSEEPILELEAIPPAALVRYCVKAARSAACNQAMCDPGTTRSEAERSDPRGEG